MCYSKMTPQGPVFDSQQEEHHLSLESLYQLCVTFVNVAAYSVY